jgi:hypothetical protein
MKVAVLEICRILLTRYEQRSSYIRKGVDNLKVRVSGNCLLPSRRVVL